MRFIFTIIMIIAAFGQESAPETPAPAQPTPAAEAEPQYLINNKDAFEPYGTSDFAEPYASGMSQDSSDATTTEGIAPTPEAAEPSGR